MLWVEDQGLAKRVLDDIRSELDVGQLEYLKNVPHTSELIYCLTRSYLNRVDSLPPTDQETMLFATGLGLEQLLLRPHRQGEEGWLDGIYWRADWVKYEEGLGEFKSTRMSAKKELGDIPVTWQRQVLSYMKAKGTREIILMVMHLMGNYAPPFPSVRVQRGHATQEEIDQNWEWMKQRRDIYMDHLERKVIPKQFTYNEDWECDPPSAPCKYLFICQARQSIDDLKEEQGLV